MIGCTTCRGRAAWECLIAEEFQVELDPVGDDEDAAPLMVSFDVDMPWLMCDACYRLFMAENVRELGRRSARAYVRKHPQHRQWEDRIAGNATKVMARARSLLIGDGLDISTYSDAL